MLGGRSVGRAGSSLATYAALQPSSGASAPLDQRIRAEYGKRGHPERAAFDASLDRNGRGDEGNSMAPPKDAQRRVRRGWPADSRECNRQWRRGRRSIEGRWACAPDSGSGVAPSFSQGIRLGPTRSCRQSPSEGRRRHIRLQWLSSSQRPCNNRQADRRPDAACDAALRSFDQ